MTILQVNVRPAGKTKDSVNSQWREHTESTSLKNTINKQKREVSTLPPIHFSTVNQDALHIEGNGQLIMENSAIETQAVPNSAVSDSSITDTNTIFAEQDAPLPEATVRSPLGTIDHVQDTPTRELPTRQSSSTGYRESGYHEYRAAPIVASLGVTHDRVTLEPTSQIIAKSPTTWQKIIWKLMPFTTVGRALNSARERLNEAGCSSASLDAQVILAYVLGVNRSWLFAHHEYKLNSEQADAFTDLIARRMEHEPVAYLVGKREFYGLDFQVDRRVLIPRPETELLVDAVLDIAADHEGERVVVADVGTGSGAIALSVAHNCPHVHVYAIDLSADALEVAHQNVERIDERNQVTLAQGDLLTPLPERVHVIVANLPYISSDTFPYLDADVRDFEPQLALEAGPEGLDVINRLLRQAAHFLLPDGTILLEIGYDQGVAVSTLAKQIFPQAQHISIRKDYHGHDRLVTIIP